MTDQIQMMFDRFGPEYYGENATQLAHALQCAYLARRDRCSDSLVAAALLHDIGQFIDDAGNAAERLKMDARHEVTGADFLGNWFGPAVTEPVRMHVDAKRYLCAAEAGYAEGLSGASLLSLRLQGGPMSDEEAQRFAAQPFFEDALRLRRYDDAGKQKGLQVPTLDTYFEMLESLATTAR